MLTKLKQNAFLWFTFKFLLIFGFLYMSCLAIIGLAAPGRYYSPFIEKYLDVISWITNTLMWGTKVFVGILGFETYTLPNFIIRIVDGTGVRIAYDCVGYGVMCFWTALVIAYDLKLKSTLKWIAIGLCLLWLINVFRIGLLLIAYNKGWGMPLGIDHHTWFNIVAYITIFGLMYMLDKQNRTSKKV